MLLAQKSRVKKVKVQLLNLLTILDVNVMENLR